MVRELPIEHGARGIRIEGGALGGSLGRAGRERGAGDGTQAPDTREADGTGGSEHGASRR
ncbi:hypothetical protein STRAU_5025 [Streptomyces aurantiacus JA 4570]|uniref:Uncharacterized protein n=1 Tax=Streptomyces aurantiacus JA 4570 TaxID=1286094 RepID=S3ZU19_9ACTN|nr:hypothetical protein STRAU_5025 [Streptomyces aurantiacus JA 4570]